VTTSDGETIHGIELGSGPRVAILSHGATGTKEDFYPLAERFAADGWRVIIYDARGVGASTGDRDGDRRLDLEALAERADADSLVLVGGSMGAGLSLAMGPALGADAVIALSPPSTAFDAIDAAPELRGTPVLLVAAEGNGPYPEEARILGEAIGVDPVIVSGDRHGTGVFRDHPELLDRVVAFADDATDRAATSSN
jgi:pimeloyl-ACP methyl ester carboxylesterase